MVRNGGYSNFTRGSQNGDGGRVEYLNSAYEYDGQGVQWEEDI